MNKCITKNAHWLLALSGLVFLPGSIIAQEDLAGIDDEEIFELSPFEVSTEGNDGYSANETLGGTRLRTDYRDLATPLTAVTSQFLEDTAATDNQSLLSYTTNTEVGGLYGNYGGFGNSQGIGDRSKLISPNNNTRVRGLEQADNTRNFFLTDAPWDSFNIDRIEIQRGPNSILFGVGSPAGIINATTIVAQMNGNSGKVENRFGQFNSNRVVADYNVEVIDDVFSVRVAGLYNDQKFRQKPGFSTDERLFATATFQKKVIPMDWADDMTVRFSYETAEVESNNPRYLPPRDGITLWFEDYAGDGVDDLIGFGKSVHDMFLYSQSGGGDAGRGSLADADVANGFYQPGVANIDGGDLNNGGIGFFFRNGESRPFFVSRQAPREYPGGLGPDGSVDNAVSSSPYGSPMRAGGFNNYAIAVDKIDEVNGNPSRYPLATRGYYKDRTLSDASIFDFYNYLIDGDNKREFKDWDTSNLSISQTFFNSKLGFEFVWDRQNYKEWRGGATWSNPFISIDINKNLQHQTSRYGRTAEFGGDDGKIDPSTYSVPGFTPSADQPYANPMAGAAILSGGFNGNERRTVDRETSRFTVFGEISASDFMDSESTLAKIIGRHVFTGLLTTEEKSVATTQWDPAATTYQWADRLSSSKGTNIQLGGAERGVTPIIYLSDPLFGAPSASGLNLGPITTYYNPSGTYNVTYFETEWLYDTDPNGPNYLDPGAPWTTGHFSEGSISGDYSLYQADNPANYTGWTQAGTEILNADDGDLDQLVTNYGVTEQTIDSQGLVWQGYLFDGLIVPTFGWRKDVLETYTGTGAEDSTGISATSVGTTEKVLDNTGETISWGIVAHAPQKFVEKLKFVSGLSAYYNVGENQKVEARYNYDGQALDNPSAESVDYGVVINLFDDKLTLKVGRYETKVKNGNLAGGSSILGANQYYLYNLEAWGTANTLMNVFGREGLDPNLNWHWNWALVDEGFDGAWDDYATKSWNNHPSMDAQLAAMDAWMANIDAQFFENYQIGANVPALKSAYDTWRSTGDVQPLIAAAADSGFAVGTYTTGFSSQNNGQINGISPNGTIDNTSKGWEVELNYRPTPNWNIQLNASKTDAFRESLGQPMLDFIGTQWAKMQGPAGDLRLWWGGDNTLRRYYEDNIISAVEFQNESIGFQVPELRPWRTSLITNYSFEGDKFKGVNVGGAMRYQDKQILGYGLKDDNSGLSVNNPIYGEDETHFDLWLGYERAITDKVDWRIQFNVRNAFEDVGLVPISANPDGSYAAQRIAEGQSWSVTNTFRF